MKKMNKNSEHVLKQIDKQLGGRMTSRVGETIPHEMRLGDVKMEQKRCGAKTKSGEACKKTALKNGRCKLHGGKSTGPKDRAKHSESLKGNKNALKHGLYETIWLDTLTEEERELYHQVSIYAGGAPAYGYSVLNGVIVVDEQLINETYTGFNMYNGQKEQNGIRQKDVFPRIISRQLWNKARQVS